MLNLFIKNDIHKSDEVFEIKYKVPKSIVNYLYSSIRHYAITPKKFSKAKLKTFYFDDQFDTSFSESVNGELRKTKYRFREYINPDLGGAYYSIEIKRRFNTETSKIKRLIYQRLPNNYNISTFKNLLSEIKVNTDLDLKEFYNNLPEKILLPSTLIQYDRDRFDSPEGDVRYNIDTNISVNLGLNCSSTTEQKIYLNHSIFEIKSKSPEFFPSFLRHLKISPSSFSKFAWGKDIISQVVQ